MKENPPGALLQKAKCEVKTLSLSSLIVAQDPKACLAFPHLKFCHAGIGRIADLVAAARG